MEKLPKTEFSEDELKLIKALKETGPENPETKEALITWTKQGEDRAAVEQREAETRGENIHRSNIEFSLRRARLYRAAGFMDEAWDHLEDARREALQADQTDLYEEAMRIMDEMDRGD